MKKKTTKPSKLPRKSKAGPDARLLQSLSMKHKEEVVLSWHCSGGVVCGERLALKDLAIKLELTEHLILKLIDVIKSSFIKQFESQKIIREQVFIMAGTLMHQMREDRARATLHNDQLDRQIEKTNKMIDAAEELSEGTWTEYSRKQKLLASLNHHMRALNAFKAESMRVLIQTTNAVSGFLGLFADKGRLPIENIPDTDGPVQYLDYVGAIRVIETQAVAILPRQALTPGGNRNPNTGFEELDAQRK